MSIFKKTIKASSLKASASPVRGREGTQRASTSNGASKKEKKESSPAVIKSAVLVRPYIKEKSAILADEKGTYVFEIAPRTNKIEIAKAVASIYGVTPVRVNIINLPSVRVFKRGKNGVKKGTRKALVTLKKGEKIEFM